MASAIEQFRSGLTIGHAQLGLHGAQQGTINQQVHDGDTIETQLDGNVGVRFLGVDAPEVSFTLPGHEGFIPIANPAWEPFLADPFAANLPPFSPPLSLELQAFLAAQLGPGTAANHARLGKAATDVLRDLVRADVAALGQTEASFRFFCAFAHEVMDGFGRLLCFLNRQQPSATDPEPRPRSYNERLLEAGWVTPYFIWPNVDPFRRQGSLVDAVLEPGTANDIAEQQGSALQVARQFVRDARAQHLGVFEQADPLRLLPFELRFLARRTPPERWVIDLGRNDDTLIIPQAYFQVADPEDRLFVPAEYMPLFVERGWHRAP
jgi:endonuclease YncB( thermonuclease family)